MNQGVRSFSFSAKIPRRHAFFLKVGICFQSRPVFWGPPPWEQKKSAHWKLGGLNGIRGKFGSGKGESSTGQLGVFATFNQKWENNSGVTTTQRAAL